MLHLDEGERGTLALEKVMEQKIRPLRVDMEKEALLNEEGVFRLEDVAERLGIPAARIKKHADDLESHGESPWVEMGIFTLFQVWVVAMPAFKLFYKRGGIPENIRDVEPHWDANRLLSERGRFRLIDVCEKLPFTINQMRYQIKNNRNARLEYGVWREPKERAMIVDMEIFSKWIREIWHDASVINRKQV
jgi:hypothetical protein